MLLETVAGDGGQGLDYFRTPKYFVARLGYGQSALATAAQVLCDDGAQREQPESFETEESEDAL